MENNPENSVVNQSNFSFGKKEKLCSKKVIEKLFSDGNSFLSYPLKFVYLKTELPVNVPVQVAFTVSKKGFKKAVKRNLIKRRMREAYRLNKQILVGDSEEDQLAVFVIFIGKEICGYQAINQAMQKALTKLSKIKAVENEQSG